MHTIGSAGVMNRRLPVGFRFNPTDEVLVAYYLTLKINGFPLPNGMDHVIPWVNFYDHSPQELIGSAMQEIKKSEEYYFFTEMEGSGKRSSRKAKGGFWKATAKDKPVYDHAGLLIGFKKSLDFYEDDKRTEFKMNEYTTTSVKISSNKFMKYLVVNKIYRNKQTVGTKRIKDADEFYCESPISAKRAKKDGDDDEVNDHMEDGQSFEEFNLEDITDFEDDQEINRSHDDQSLAEFFNGLDDITNYKIHDEEKDNQVNHFDGQNSLATAHFNMDDITVDNRIGHENMFVEGYMPSNVFAILPDEHWQVHPFDVNQSHGFILSELDGPDSILADPKASQCDNNSDFCGSGSSC